MPSADVVVAGLGVAGAATTLALARSGASVVALDPNPPGHHLGSSHGETRITRVAVGEGDAYVPLVARSHECWRELESEDAGELLVTCGLLVLGGPGGTHHGRGSFVDATVWRARRHGIDHELLDPADVAARFEAIVPPAAPAYFEPGGGYLHAEACVRALCDAARRHGARLAYGDEVLGWEDTGSRLRVHARSGPTEADRLVVCAGPWLPELVPALASTLTVQRQVVHWLEVEPDGAGALGELPAYLWFHGDGVADMFYGFPLLGGRAAGLKVATEVYGAPTTPGTVDRGVARGAARALHAEHVHGRLAGVRPSAVASSVCLYTVADDFGFVLDAVPGDPRVVVVSACSGHGFKHAPAVGECAAALALGERPPIDCSAFSLARFS